MQDDKTTVRENKGGRPYRLRQIKPLFTRM